MDNKDYDIFIIGHISLDENIYQGKVERMIGGATPACAYAAKAGGYKVGILTKVAKKDINSMKIFDMKDEDINLIISNETTSIRNEYLTEDREKRICSAIGIAEAYSISEIPEVNSKIYHLAGLMAGDFDNNMIKYLSTKGKVAIDAQGFVRHVIDGKMVYKDWKEKTEYMPYVDFFKADAAEAELLTGSSDRKVASKILFSYGAKEIMISHNTEVLIYDGSKFYRVPLKPRNLSGRTGRGDTCFSAYITKRLNKNIPEALLYASALVSLKIETPGPFKGSSKDVEKYIKEFYSESDINVEV